MNVSIVVPGYNAAETIQETLASIQAQTVPNWEAVVVNDGSTDETEAIVQEIAAQDTRSLLSVLDVDSDEGFTDKYWKRICRSKQGSKD